MSNSGQHQLYGAQSEQDNGYYIHSRAKRSDESEEEYRVSVLLLKCVWVLNFYRYSKLEAVPSCHIFDENFDV